MLLLLTWEEKRSSLLYEDDLVRKIVHFFTLCRKMHAKVSQQFMSELPVERVAGDHAAFKEVGVDCFGPFETVHGRKRK